MEGTGDSGNGPERRAARLLMNIDLNVKPEPEEEEEQVPHNDAPQVVNPNPQPPAPPRNRAIHDLEGKTTKMDVFVGIKKTENNEVEMVVSSTKLALAGNLEVRGADVLGHGEIGLRRLGVNNMGGVDGNNSSAQASRVRASQELTGPGMKRARTSTNQTNDRTGSAGDAASSSAEERSAPSKIKPKTQGMEGDAKGEQKQKT